ncbi:hypothetical protein Tco_0864317 [Tanacetum coccineum]
MQSSSISSEFANQFLNLDNAPPADNKVVSMMNVKVRHKEPSTQTPSLLTIPVMVILKTLTAAAPTIPPTIPLITPLPQLVSVLEKELSQLKQVDYSAQLLETIKSQIPAMVDAQLSTSLKDSIQKAFRSYTVEFEKKAQDEKKRYINLIEKSVKEIIKDEVNTQLPQILPKEISDFATPVIQSTITKSLENVVLAKSSSQPQSTYEASTSLTKFELKKILLDKMQKSKSYRGAQQHKELYDGLVKSYKLDKDLFESYGKAYSIKRDREDKDKDEDPYAGSDQGLKRRKTRKDAGPSKGSKSKESKSSSSKGTKPQPKSSGKFAQAEESVFEASDTEMPQNQRSDLGHTDDQPNVDAASKHDWFMKPEIPSTPNPDWNARKFVDFRPPQTWISIIAQAKNQLDWNNPEGQEYSFDLSKPLPLIEDRGCQVVPVEYFFNNDLEYLKGGSSSRKYMTSITKTKAASITDVYQTYCHFEAYGRSSTGSRKLLEEAQYHQARDIQYKRNRLIRSDELYKFSDGTLTFVRDVLYDIATNLRMDYLPLRKWSNLDRKRYRMMIKAIDKLLFEGRLMRSLEKLVGRRDYRNDLKLLEWTI